MQKAVRSWCQNSPQLAAWACQLHILVPKQKKPKESNNLKKTFMLGDIREKTEVGTGQSAQLCLAAVRNGL